jgi:small GTP-binding protein
MNKKVILVGHFGVGKTSLVQQFVHSKFSETYLTTIGVKIDKKTINLDGMEVNLLIWDIAGETAQNKVPKSYQLGAHGVLYVFDLSRPSTYNNLHEQLNYLKELLPTVPIEILANKKDLLTEQETQKILNELALDIKTTSAKTGENVEEAFMRLTKSMIG